MLQKRDTACPRRLRQLNYISQFTTSITHTDGSNNVVADTLSRIAEVNLPDNYEQLAEAQALYEELPSLQEQFRIQHVTPPGTKTPIACETSLGNPRPILPPQFRFPTFTKLHGLAHPGIRASRRLISQRYFWPGMQKDIKTWAQNCLPCQASKVNRHTITTPGTFAPAERLQHVHIDIVGPLPPAQGQRYLLTMIDRATGWPEAVPLPNIRADTVAYSFFHTWLARYGMPTQITTDQGRQFESDLFQRLTRLMGINKLRTTAYHPQSNGILERWHRSLKAALTASLKGPDWIEALPTVLLGLRTASRADLEGSAAERLYGQTLRLPGEVFGPSPAVQDDKLRLLQQQFRRLQPTTASKRIFVHPALATCTHIFLKRHPFRTSLQTPYQGPYKVINRDNKTITVSREGKETRVSMDDVKPAFYVEQEPHRIEPILAPRKKVSFNINTTHPESTEPSPTP